MAREIKRFAIEGIFYLPDDGIRKLCKKNISVLYGSNLYSSNLKYINEIKQAIYKDYPDKNDEDLEVFYVTHTESSRHARMMMIHVKIPVEDFIKFRQEGQIYLL